MYKHFLQIGVLNIYNSDNTITFWFMMPCYSMYLSTKQTTKNFLGMSSILQLLSGYEGIK